MKLAENKRSTLLNTGALCAYVTAVLLIADNWIPGVCCMGIATCMLSLGRTCRKETENPEEEI